MKRSKPSDLIFNKVLTLLLAGFLPLLVVASPAGSMESLSNSEMSSVTGQDGITIDAIIPSTLSINEVTYTDNDGIDGSGFAGTLKFDNISPTSGFFLSGLTIDADGSTDINGTNQGAIIFDFPQIVDGAGNPTDVTIESSDFFFEESGSAAGRVQADIAEIENNKLELSALGEGIEADLDLDLELNNVTLTDRAAGTNGVMMAENISINDSVDYSGTAAPLEGLQINADGDAMDDNSGGMVVDGPSGQFSLVSQDIHAGPSGASDELVTDFRLLDVDVSNTEVRIGSVP